MSIGCRCKLGCCLQNVFQNLHETVSLGIPLSVRLLDNWRQCSGFAWPLPALALHDRQCSYFLPSARPECLSGCQQADLIPRFRESNICISFFFVLSWISFVSIPFLISTGCFGHCFSQPLHQWVERRDHPTLLGPPRGLTEPLLDQIRCLSRPLYGHLRKLTHLKRYKCHHVDFSLFIQSLIFSSIC